MPTGPNPFVLAVRDQLLPEGQTPTNNLMAKPSLGDHGYGLRIVLEYFVLGSFEVNYINIDARQLACGDLLSQEIL